MSWIRKVSTGIATRLCVLAARARGQMGRSDQALTALEGALDLPAGLLEPEERVMLLVHAGAGARATPVTQETELEGRVVELLRSRRVDWTLLSELDLEDYRLARLIYDLHVADPERLAPPVRRRAASILRAHDAQRLAVRLEATLNDPWVALETFLGGPATAARARALFAEVGCHDLRLVRGARGVEELVVDGVGGRESFELHARDGSWSARADSIDDLARCLVRLVADRLGRFGSGREVRVSSSESSGLAPSAGLAGSLSPLPDGVIGSAPALLNVFEELTRLATGELPIMILGETGTGKERAARAVHERSSRRAKPYVAVNCAALTESLLMSELFGHVRGAFTGANEDRAGVFESARGGTVFLDEIGDLAPAAQGMLLRVLQEGEVRRVGESRSRLVDVRIVAATHRDLASLVAVGTFREDLFYRLAVAVCELPALRDRGEDVIRLAEHFLETSSPDRGPRILGIGQEGAGAALLGRVTCASSEQSLRALRRWQAAAGMRASPISPGTLTPEDLRLPEPVKDTSDWHEWLDRLKRERLVSELEACDGNRARRSTASWLDAASVVLSRQGSTACSPSSTGPSWFNSVRRVTVFVATGPLISMGSDKKLALVQRRGFGRA